MEITIKAEPRPTGKKAAKEVRRKGYVPAVVYGHHVEPTPVQVPRKALNPLIYTHETHRVELEVDGKKWTCVLKDIDFHPITDEPIHADFQVLRAGEKIYLKVPISTVGTAIGQEHGGELVLMLHELEIEALPKDIPPHIEIDVSNLDIGDVIHVRDLDLPNITILTAPEQAIVGVIGRAAETPEESAEETGEATETE